MAVTNQNSTQWDALHGSSPSTVLGPDYNGALRVAIFEHDQSGAGDATSDVKMVKLPPGRVRLFLPLSYAYVNWTTSSATLDLGWDAYVSLTDGSAVAADPNGLVDGLDVDAAGIFNFTAPVAAILAAGGSKLFESREGVTILATTQDVAIVSGDDLAGFLVYSYLGS